MNWDSKEFKKLQDKWYKKLANSGFEDIENIREDGKESSFTLKYSYKNELTRTRNHGKEFWNASRAEYYRLAGHFYHDYKFNSEVDKIIWGYHCEGYTLTEISNLLKNHKIKKARTQVKESIHKIRDIMFEKNGFKRG